MLRQNYQQMVSRWLDRRLPSVESLILNQRSLFIAPNMRGLSVLGLSLVLWVAAITYQNNAIMLLAALLMALLIVAIAHTFINMNGIRIRALHPDSCHAGQAIQLPVAISRQAGDSYNLKVGWRREQLQSTMTQITSSDQRVVVSLPTNRRGRLKAPRLCVESTFPLGLIRCWTYAQLDFDAVVWPEVVPYNRIKSSASGDQEGLATGNKGVDDFDGLATYIEGDSMARVAWKQVAAGRGMQTKVFGELVGQSQWLTLESAEASQLELKLGQLTAMALDMNNKGVQFGLRLPLVTIDIGGGDRHLVSVLNALATYGVERC